MKQYLGDGVYIEYKADRHMVKLWTTDGVTEKNIIWLEPEVQVNLIKFFETLAETFK